MPVRKASELFGYKVDFKNNEVILSNQNELILEEKEGDKLKIYTYKVKANFETVEEIECIIQDNEIYVNMPLFGAYYRFNHETGKVLQFHYLIN